MSAIAAAVSAWGVNEWVAALSALIAVISLALNWLIVRRQTVLQFESLKAQLDAELMIWAHGAIDLISDGVALAKGRGVAYPTDEYRRLLLETSQRISSAADRGRLFFPNEAPDAHGQDKEGAFQGFRPPILDAAVFACGQLDRIDTNSAGPDEEAAAFLMRCRRLFVSELQNAIDPRRRGAMLRQLAEGRLDDAKSSFRVAAELGEALEARYPGFLIQRRDAQWIAAREKYARKKR